ncbi:MAG: alpha/beta fold hydrolase, partial [bacterium]
MMATRQTLKAFCVIMVAATLLATQTATSLAGYKVDVCILPLIGGIKQGIVLQGADGNNPILLYVHGGPGRPVYPVLYKEEQWAQLEKVFTIAYWDQRGSGMSNPADLDPDTINLDRMIEDTAEVSRFLAKRFGKEKIYILGHSWGTLLSALTVQRYPKLFHAYIGVGQVGYQLKSEEETLAWLKKKATSTDDNEVRDTIESLRVPQTFNGFEWFTYLGSNRDMVSRFHGGFYQRTFTYDEYMAGFAQWPYTEQDRAYQETGSIQVLIRLYPVLLRTDMSVAVPELD